MVGADGRLPLPWLAAPLRDALERRAHAILLHGPEGVGQFELALTLAQGWLCESAEADRRPCGACASCRLVQARSHPDLLVLLPEVLREALGWAGGEGEEGDKGSKAKPSKEIKVEAVRAAVAFAQTTSARGRGKVVVLHPAERANLVASNTLLKTLEEPPGAARFVLSCAAPDALLPTIRSRCQMLALGVPAAADAIAWLQQQDIPKPEVLLAACGGQPLQALQWSREGVDARFWTELPERVRRGEAVPFLAWPLPRLVEALQKLCHDALCVAAGAKPRYFPPASLKPGPSLERLSEWARSLARIARHAEHPWTPGLMVEALIDEGRASLTPPAAAQRGARSDSLHSRP